MRSQFKGYFHSLLVGPITGEHFKLNPSTVDKCKLKLWLQMYVPVVYFLHSCCTNRFSYSLSCLVLQLQNYWLDSTEILTTHSLDTVDNA